MRGSVPAELNKEAAMKVAWESKEFPECHVYMRRNEVSKSRLIWDLETDKVLFPEIS